MSDHILNERKGDGTYITINRADVNGVLTDAMTAELAGMIDEAGKTSKFIVYRSAGADFCTGRSQCPHIVNVQAGQTCGNAIGQRGAASAVGQKVSECLRRGGKTTRHTHASVSKLADHLAQRCILATDGLDVRHPQIFERNDVSRPQIRGLMSPLGWYVGHDNYLFDDEKSSWSASQPGVVLIFLGRAAWKKLDGRHFTGRHPFFLRTTILFALILC